MVTAGSPTFTSGLNSGQSTPEDPVTDDALAYPDVLPEPLRAEVARSLVDVQGVEGLRIHPSLLERFPQLHAPDRLAVLADVARTLAEPLRRLLAARVTDQAFLDAAVQAHRTSPGAPSPFAARDADGRLVMGPAATTAPVTPVTLPPHLQPPAVTLFGPPDDARMCLHAMNAVHRRRDDEPPVVTRHVERALARGNVPYWGADSEDSKTPFVPDLLQATANLSACLEGSLSVVHPRTGATLKLADAHRSVPIKRIPGLGLPDALHQLDGRPLPLHVVDFVLHALHAPPTAEALTFYVPKLENEEEAAYVHDLVAAVEAHLAARHPGFAVGTTRLFVVFETPRAIFRIAEMAEALHPYLAGGSLGWHDFLAATARTFRRDPSYRIPVKADPDIVINHIKESHVALVRALRPRGAVCIGGMYGTLFEDGVDASFQASMVGYVRDVVTQLRRGLDGFWVAHPDFVRIGLALVTAWEEGPEAIDELVAALVPDPAALEPLQAFLHAPDVPGLPEDHPDFPRAMVAADLPPDHPSVTNHHREEVAYNVFQAVQYLAAWLQGTGCVALPASLATPGGEPVFVRVMDDLATTERSRWELWHEVHHGRVSRATFDEILAEQLAFLRAGVDTATKRVAVPYTAASAPWYAVAERMLRRLVTDPEPVASVSEWLLPFTLDEVRQAPDPWRKVCEAKGLPA